MAIPSPQQNSADQAQFALNLKGIGNKNSLFYRHFHLVPGVFEFDHSKFQMTIYLKHRDEFGLGWRIARESPWRVAPEKQSLKQYNVTISKYINLTFVMLYKIYPPLTYVKI